MEFRLRLSASASEYSGLISFRMDWFVLSALQGTLRSLLQQHSLKASILRRSAFFRVQLSQPYMTGGKTTALTIWNFLGKVMSLLFNAISPGWLSGKEPACRCRRQEMRVQSLGWEDPLEEEMATLLQYSCLKNFMDRGAWWVTVHGIAKSQT